MVLQEIKHFQDKSPEATLCIQNLTHAKRALKHICIFGNGYVCKGRIAILSFTLADDRTNYGEPRFITAGWLNARFVVLVWTPRQDGRRIISMRYGHADEEAYYRQQWG